MWLALSLILSSVLLSGRLFIHNKMMLAKNDSEKEKVAKQLLVVTWIIMACSFGVLITGIIVKSLENNFIPVGYTLLATSIVFMIQSETLKLKETKVKSFASIVRAYAFIFFWLSSVGLVAIITTLVVNYLRTK